MSVDETSLGGLRTQMLGRNPRQGGNEQVTNSAHTQEEGIGYGGHLRMLPILGSLFVSFCMVQLCTLISLPRIFLLLVERRP